MEVDFTETEVSQPKKKKIQNKVPKINKKGLELAVGGGGRRLDINYSFFLSDPVWKFARAFQSKRKIFLILKLQIKLFEREVAQHD